MFCNFLLAGDSRRKMVHEQRGRQDKGVANEALGKIKQGVGSMTGDEKLQAQGKARQIKGAAQKTVGDVKQGAGNATDFAAHAIGRIV